MIYPKNAVDKLGYTDIKALIKEKCLSEAAKEMVDKIQPQVKLELIDRYLRQANEFKNLLQNDAALPVDHIYPIKAIIEKAKVEGAFLFEDEFYRILLSLRTVYAIIRYFNEREQQYPNLELLFEHLPIEKSIVRSIEQVIDERGKMKDNASRLLLEITQQISKSEQEARKRIDSIYKQAQQNGWTADGSLTIRDGRLCIPILAENKRKIKGLIHDESATGQTAYIEPEEVFHLNNKVRDLEFERRREVIRILTDFKCAPRRAPSGRSIKLKDRCDRSRVIGFRTKCWREICLYEDRRALAIDVPVGLVDSMRPYIQIGTI